MTVCGSLGKYYFEAVGIRQTIAAKIHFIFTIVWRVHDLACSNDQIHTLLEKAMLRHPAKRRYINNLLAESYTPAHRGSLVVGLGYPPASMLPFRQAIK